MMFRTVIIAISLVACAGEWVYQPEQIHLSYGDQKDEMVVTWVTQNLVAPSVVQYGMSISTLNSKVIGQPTKFTDDGPEKRNIYIHRVTLTNLTSAKAYYYYVGSDKGWSSVYSFKAMDASSDWSPTLAVFGDMGTSNSRSLPYLQQEAIRETVNAVLHIGDFAYDMNEDNGRNGDAFMNEIQSIATYLPYMTCVGNHENAYNFSHYRQRFTMPRDGHTKMYYSFNIGPAHIISISTEGYFYPGYKIAGGTAAVKQQYEWLLKDLQLANTAKMRAAQPWIIVVGHRPMYCSTDDTPCNNYWSNTLRVGRPSLGMPGVEELFYKYGVDLQMYAHEHSYERLYPVYNLTVCGGEKSMYVDPKAPVHVVVGSGGNREGEERFEHKVHPWSAFRSMDYGYTRMRLLNATHINFEQVSINQRGKVIDEFTLVKTKHGAGLYDCH